MHRTAAGSQDKLAETLRILEKVPGSSIIYVRSRGKTKEVAEWLRAYGVTAEHYHAGLTNADKDLKQQAWQAGDVRVMVATNAFGMGIDKPDVRTVIHLDLPDSIEAYFQEAGRAGRDGKPAYAVLLYADDDHAKMLQRVHNQFPKRDFILRVYDILGNWLQVGLGSGLDHTFPFPFEQFCADNRLPLLPTFSALQILTQAGYITYIDEHETQPRVQILPTRDELYEMRLPDGGERLLNALMRQYPGIFTEPAYIYEDRLSAEMGLDKLQLNQALIMLAQQGLVRYIPRRKTPYIYYAQERLQLDYLRIPENCYEERLERYRRQTEAMLTYATLPSDAKPEEFLLNYFGEGKCLSLFVLAVLATDVLGMNTVDESSASVQTDGAVAVSAVPQALEAFLAVRCFVVDKQHITFLADDVRHHAVEPCALLHVPDDVGGRFLAAEARAATRPELGEIEFESATLIAERREKFARKSQKSHFRAASAYVEDAVRKAIACQFADQIAGREPNPGRSETLAPVFVGVAEARVAVHQITPAVQDYLAIVIGFHAFCVPEHLEELPASHGAARAVAYVEGDTLADTEIPTDLSALTHPFGVLFGFGLSDRNISVRLRFREETVVRLNRERYAVVHANLFPAEEPVQLSGILAPTAYFHHQVGGFNSFRLVFRKLPEDGKVSAQGGIAEEELQKERLFFARFGVSGSETVPPPVVA